MLALAIASTLVAIAIGSETAYGAATRAEYVAQADPICQQAYQQERADFKTFARRVKKALPQLNRGHFPKGTRRVVVRYYHRSLQTTQNMLIGISPIPAAPGDESTVATWLSGLQSSVNEQRRALRALRRGHLRRYVKLFTGAFVGGLHADASVRDFGFSYCTRVTVLGPF